MNWNLAGPTGPGMGIYVYIDGTSTHVGDIPNTYAGGSWGFYSDTYFTSVVLTEWNQTDGIIETNERDNMVFAPAPGAILLGGIGVGLVGSLRKRKAL